MKKNIFIDFEYANRELDITEVGVSYIDDKNEAKLLYHSFVKLSAEVEIDPITFKIAQISLQTLNKFGKPIEDIKVELNKLIEGSDIYHWGGAEKSILINKLCINNFATIIDLSKEEYISNKKLLSFFKECFPFQSSINSEMHCAQIDSFITALIYKKFHLSPIINDSELMVIQAKIKEKNEIIKIFKEKENELRRNAYGFEKGEYFSKKTSVYFSGFKSDEKELLRNKYQLLGITIKGSKDNADFIVFKNIHEARVQKYKDRALTLEDFEILLKTGELKIAS